MTWFATRHGVVTCCGTSAGSPLYARAAPLPSCDAICRAAGQWHWGQGCGDASRAAEGNIQQGGKSMGRRWCTDGSGGPRAGATQRRGASAGNAPASCAWHRSKSSRASGTLPDPPPWRGALRSANGGKGPHNAAAGSAKDHVFWCPCNLYHYMIWSGVAPKKCISLQRNFAVA